MHQKVRSITTSSKSGTSKTNGVNVPALETPIQFIKGVGPKAAALFETKGIRTVRDALFYFPRDYQDRSRIRTIGSIQSGETVLIRGKVLSYRYQPMRNRYRPILEARVEDNTGILSVKWFQYNKTFMEGKLKPRPKLVAYGAVRAFGTTREMIHPDIEWDVEDADLASSQRILPVYSETEGLHQKLIRKVMAQAVAMGADFLVDEIPEPVRRAHQLVDLKSAVKSLHAPLKSTSLEELKAFNVPEQRRLIFDELFKFEWVVGRRRLNMRVESTKSYPATSAQPLVDSFKKRLPFELTDDQLASIGKIYDDLSQTRPMNRLLQGDVGCGKTLVALAACLPVFASGGQTALMVPTEILAEQHLLNSRKYIESPSCVVELLTGSTPKSKREDILSRLAAGQIQLIIGTHALIEDPVIFQELGLIITDEQHRFGVDQRMKLRAKGRHPHVLSLTATPIPRTLALTAYGDLDVSTIRTMPKGRPAIHTKIYKTSDRDNALEVIRSEIAKGRQAYIIYPLVEESEKIDLANAVEGAEELTAVFKNFKVGLLHGRMKPQEKSEVMNSFKEGKIQVLVSTTVVEVGVDVPNATALMIEHAERFGLSQLHQLRGRIGRGTETSYCILMASGASPFAYQRLQIMEETRDGFKLAEFDLETRGPGEFLGTRQSGELQFQYASLIRDQLILQEARQAAFDLLKTDPELTQPEHAPLRAYMQRAGHLQQKRFQTA